jgi:hypothetical protein
VRRNDDLRVDSAHASVEECCLPSTPMEFRNVLASEQNLSGPISSEPQDQKRSFFATTCPATPPTDRRRQRGCHYCRSSGNRRNTKIFDPPYLRHLCCHGNHIRRPRRPRGPLGACPKFSRIARLPSPQKNRFRFRPFRRCLRPSTNISSYAS